LAVGDEITVEKESSEGRDFNSRQCPSSECWGRML